MGKRLLIGWWSGDDGAEVVGVARSVRGGEVGIDDPQTIYRLSATYAYVAQPLVVRTSTDRAPLIDNLRAVLQDLHPTVPMDAIEMLGGFMDQQLAGLRFSMSLIGAFAACGLLISIIGLYGVVSYVAAQRTREMGIRMAVGADRPRIFRMVLGQGVVVAFARVAAGLVGGRWITGILGSLLYGVSATDVVSFTAAALFLGAIATLACWVPAARVSRCDSMRSPRSE